MIMTVCGPALLWNKNTSSSHNLGWRRRIAACNFYSEFLYVWDVNVRLDLFVCGVFWAYSISKIPWGPQKTVVQTLPTNKLAFVFFGADSYGAHYTMLCHFVLGLYNKCKFHPPWRYDQTEMDLPCGRKLRKKAIPRLCFLWSSISNCGTHWLDDLQKPKTSCIILCTELQAQSSDCN